MRISPFNKTVEQVIAEKMGLTYDEYVEFVDLKHRKLHLEGKDLERYNVLWLKHMNHLARN